MMAGFRQRFIRMWRAKDALLLGIVLAAVDESLAGMPQAPLIIAASMAQAKNEKVTSDQPSYGFQFGPVCTIHKEAGSDYAWRVKQLTFENGGTGLLHAYSCLFTIPKYWDYGCFTSKERCELPGKLFRARASGKPGDQHHFLTPAFWGAVSQYRMADGRFYIAWRVRSPERRVASGRYSCVSLSDGPWEVWCNRGDDGKIAWTVEALQGGKRIAREIQADPSADGWFDVQLVVEPRELTLQINHKECGRFAHDPYERPFYIQFGSKQPTSGGAEVVSEYREVFVNSVPSPYKGMKYAEGPEDIRPADNAIVGYLHESTPQSPRGSEGDILITKDGGLLAVYSHYYAGKGWDDSPARLVGRISKDGGKTWGQPWTVADRDEGSHGNVMSVSLLRGKNGDVLMVYYDKTPDMPAKGMVLRRSADEGKTWSKRIAVTPTHNTNRHVANNACLVRLSGGRIILAVREYIGGIRWPYACYSDDDGGTWKAGSRVPDPGLTAFQKRHQNVNEPSICELADGRLLMTMRSIAGGQFFSWSTDQGQTWSKPVLSPLRGTCGPALLSRIPDSDDILAIWAYGYGGRCPLTSAVSSDGGRTWKHLKLLEQSQYHGYGYVSCTYVKDRAVLSYMHAPGYSSVMRFDVEPGYIDTRFVSLPIAWFYRDP